MKERPILFNGAMVRAIINGSKTQTRRVMKCQPTPLNQNKPDGYYSINVRGTNIRSRAANEFPGFINYCPCGQPGDRLWVRETWQGPIVDDFDSYLADPDKFNIPQHCEYAADGGPAPEFITMDDELVCRWLPSIHMPRWASRINLEITAVRVERLNDISEADAKAEGVEQMGVAPGLGLYRNYLDPMTGYIRPDDSFSSLWNSVNGADSWAANPWVWVVSFRRLP